MALMPRAGSALELLVSLEHAEGRLHRRLEEQLRLAIRSGVLPPGSPLPSSRMLAVQLGVSRGVVVEAYGQLVAEGYMSVRARSAPRVAGGGKPTGSSAAGPVDRPRRPRVDLYPGVPALDAFPRAAWLSCYRRVLRSVGDAELGYSPPAGHPRLREELADYLARVRGVVVGPDRVVITQGVTQAIGLAGAVLRARGVERIAVEDPSHRDVHELVARAGLTLVPVPVDEQGIDVAALARTRAQAVLLTPAHQFPTGVLLSPARRAALLRWLHSGHRYVIEDDYDAELRYGGSPVGAVQGLLPQRVIYTSSTSKALIPGLRLGWLLPPPELAAEVVERKHFSDLGSPVLDQLAFADFLRRGELDRHLRRVRARYRRRREALVDAVDAHFPGSTVLGIPAGLHLAVEVDADEDELRRRALEASIRVGGLKDHRLVAYRPPTLLIGFALHREDVLRDAIHRLALI